jgi:serine/threonine protein kinase
MSQWPTQQDYDDAIKTDITRGSRIKGLTLRTYSADEAKAIGASFWKGRPYSDKGNIAVVYQLSEKGSQAFVFRVFTGSGSSIGELQQRYTEISQLVKQWPNKWLVNVEWLSEGLMINGQWRPAVLMERVDGVDLDKWLQQNRTNAAKLDAIANELRRLAKDLEQHNVAHGDLSHRNLMVSTAGHLKLVDYDGVFLPSLSTVIPKESGVPGMQHPQRKIGSSYGLLMDRFSVLVLYATFLYIKLKPNGLPKQCDDGLILLREHFLNPAGSPLDDMLQSPDPELRMVANAIVKASKQPFAETPTLGSCCRTRFSCHCSNVFTV